MAYTQADYLDYFDEVLQPIYRGGSIDKKHLRVWLTDHQNYILTDNVQNFSPQFFGESFLGVVMNEYIESGVGDSTKIAELLTKMNGNEVGATNLATKLLTPRTYSTYCPAVIGYDPLHEITYEDSGGVAHNIGFFTAHTSEIGGLASWTNRVRDSSFVAYSDPPTIVLHVMNSNGAHFNFYIEAEGNSDATDSDKAAYTTPNCYRVRNTSGQYHTIDHPSDLKVYLVLCRQYSSPSLRQYCMKWVIYSEPDDYIFVGGADTPFFGEPTDDDEGDEPEVPIPIPALPTLDISSAGVRLFKAGNFNTLINYMWGNGSIFDAINKLIGDQTPYECIVAMNLFPYGEALYTGANANIQIGNIDTYVSAPTTNQFASIDFGTATISRRFNNALDFAPYTIVELFLPFIGRVKLPTDFVMGKTIGVTYHMDCLTGGCFAFITTNVDGVIQCEGGSCLIQLPLTAQTANGARQAISSAMSAGVSFAVGSGMSSTITTNMKSAERLTAGAGVVGSIGNGIQNTLNALSAKDSYTTFGGISLANGYLGLSNPVLYIHRPIDATPSGYNNIMGYAASTIQSLGSLSGFTQVKEINLGVAGASREDLDEIEALLKEGVIL